ncbi:MAG: hypothetical protein F6K41_23000 [Symploca sp. SIO3E6]|nr:hypothetical protein [Caldora sp. SIO3E6]
MGSGGAEERRKKRELIIFGYNAQEIPPKISFTRRGEIYKEAWEINPRLLPSKFLELNAPEKCR